MKKKPIRHKNLKEKLHSRRLIYAKCITTKSICIEIGVYTGDNALTILEYNPEHLYLVDRWRQEDRHKVIDTIYKRFRHNDKITIMPARSPQAAENFKDEYFDFLYLDAGHEKPWIQNDLKAWFPKVKIGGYFSGDDCWQKPERKYAVVEAIDDFLKWAPVEIIYFDKAKTFPLPGCGQYCFKKLDNIRI